MSDLALETMRPNPVWSEAGYEDAVGTFERRREEITIKVWCGDWCPDCRGQLPDFAAALAAAEVPDECIEMYPVEKADDGSKVGPGVDEYEVTLIPTVVVEIDGETVARFEEEADVPLVVDLARQLEDATGP